MQSIKGKGGKGRLDITLIEVHFYQMKWRFTERSSMFSTAKGFFFILPPPKKNPRLASVPKCYSSSDRGIYFEKYYGGGGRGLGIKMAAGEKKWKLRVWGKKLKRREKKKGENGLKTA